jgi:hypothetical protein
MVVQSRKQFSAKEMVEFGIITFLRFLHFRKHPAEKDFTVTGNSSSSTKSFKIVTSSPTILKTSDIISKRTMKNECKKIVKILFFSKVIETMNFRLFLTHINRIQP